MLHFQPPSDPRPLQITRKHCVASLNLSDLKPKTSEKSSTAIDLSDLKQKHTAFSDLVRSSVFGVISSIDLVRSEVKDTRISQIRLDLFRSIITEDSKKHDNLISINHIRSKTICTQGV